MTQRVKNKAKTILHAVSLLYIHGLESIVQVAATPVLSHCRHESMTQSSHEVTVVRNSLASRMTLKQCTASLLWCVPDGLELPSEMLITTYL